MAFHSSHKIIFQIPAKKQYRSTYSDQSQQQQTARSTNQSSQQLLVTCRKPGKIRAYKVRLVFFFFASHCLKNWSETFKSITERNNLEPAHLSSLPNRFLVINKHRNICKTRWEKKRVLLAPKWLQIFPNCRSSENRRN